VFFLILKRLKIHSISKGNHIKKYFSLNILFNSIFTFFLLIHNLFIKSLIAKILYYRLVKSIAFVFNFFNLYLVSSFLFICCQITIREFQQFFDYYVHVVYYYLCDTKLRSCHRVMLFLQILILILWCIIISFVFVYCIGKLNIIY